MTNPALNLAIERAGGVSKLASAIGRKPNVVSNWRLAGRNVPQAACPAIERATGVTCELLLPELAWRRDDDGNIYVVLDDNNARPSQRVQLREVEGLKERNNNSG